MAALQFILFMGLIMGVQLLPSDQYSTDTEAEAKMHMIKTK